MINIPVIETNPAKGILLPLVQLLIAMGIMNLILAVVVDRSVEARTSEANTIYITPHFIYPNFYELVKICNGIV